jgi:myosin heavy subunit
MSIDPSVESAFSTLTGLQSRIEEISKLKQGGEVKEVDGKVKVVQKNILKRAWDWIRGKKPDPEMNVKGLQTMERQCANDLRELQKLLNDKNVSEEVKGQIRNSLAAILKGYDSASLKGYEKRMEGELSYAAKKANMNLDRVKADFQEAGVDKFPDNLVGSAREAAQRTVAFLHLAGPAIKVAGIPQVQEILDNQRGSEVSKLDALLSHAFSLVTGQEIIPEVELPSTSAGAAPAPDASGGAPPPPVGNAPPPPPMSPDEALKLAAAKKKENEARRKAEAEAKRQKEIKETKAAKAKVQEKIGGLEGDITALSKETTGLQEKAKAKREEAKKFDDLYKGDKRFQGYEKAVRTIDDAKARAAEAAKELEEFKAEYSARAEILQNFIDSGRGTMDIQIVRDVQDIDTKQVKEVEQTDTIKRDKAVRMLKVEYDAPLVEKEIAVESARNAVTNMEKMISDYKDLKIDGKSFQVFVKEYQKMKNALSEVETKLVHLNGEKYGLQDQVKLLKNEVNRYERALARLENRKANIKEEKKAGFDPGEIGRKMQAGGGPVRLRNIKLAGRVKYGDAAAPTGKKDKAASAKSSDAESASGKKAGGFFRNLFGLNTQP